MSESKTSSYGNIFKTTFLFGFVQVFNIFVKVCLNKLVAVLLGAEGMGIIGIYNSAIQMIRTGASLGVNQSAVRDISEANACKDNRRFSRIITLTNKVILITALLGMGVTIALSHYFSRLYFGDESYTIAFVWISIVVALNILSEGQLAILKGMRQLRALAKASILGSLVGLISAIPFYYFFGRGGIIPSLAITGFAALLFSNMYVRRIEYTRIKMSLSEIWKEATPMVKMGIALMLVSFMGAVFDMIVAAYISNTGSLADVGYYNAGAAIISGYFGIVITAMSTDYYPRISAVYNNNEKLADEMNKQSETGLVMVFPLVILFVFLSPLFINILYNSEFYETNNYTDYAMVGTVIIVVSNCIGMILLAKQASNIFIIFSFVIRMSLVGIYVWLYKSFGIKGLGWGYISNGVLNLIPLIIIMKRKYNINLEKRVIVLLVTVIIFTFMAIFLRSIPNPIMKYTTGLGLFGTSLLYTYVYMKKNMQIDLLNVIKRNIQKK